MNINNFASHLIEDLFKNFSQKNIDYIVLRNYELLPLDNESKDVDILVSPEQKDDTIKILKDTAKANGYKCIWINPLDYLVGFVFIKIIDNNIYSVKLDIFDGFKWRGNFYLDHKVILNSATSYNNFSVPIKVHESFIMIIYYILYAREIKNKYIENIYKNAISNIIEFEKIVINTLGEKISQKILTSIKKKDIQNLCLLRNDIKNHLIMNNFKKHNIFINFFKHIKTEFIDRKKFGTVLYLSGLNKNEINNSLLEIFYGLGISNNKIIQNDKLINLDKNLKGNNIILSERIINKSNDLRYINIELSKTIHDSYNSIFEKLEERYI